MAATQHPPHTQDDASPERMAAAGVPFALARWYHLVGRRLSRASDWDIERIMQVRLQIAQAGG
ncbi:hypothetical protein [Rubrivivax rivuli]|uniref:Uncharacterized protein n=1 Tax=Rubrivivax rivuli TaxID=1862385 RepID=A0A437RGV6_9BURK|nr:hypothetical protein [Rubrivivax rivuli]RVU46007.1 hypothetical protein EOE66_09015 [Rubrivivax rivuli]